jgi:hypothetical protein
MMRFPFNTTGKHLEKCLNQNEDLRLLFHPVFSPEVPDYVLTEADVRGGKKKKARVRGEHLYERSFDIGTVTKDEYMNLKTDPKVYLTDGTMSLWGRWFLRNPNTDFEHNVATYYVLMARRGLRFSSLG